MDIAALFNSDHPSLGGWYGGAVMKRILATNVLQASERPMRVLSGDVATYGKRRTLSGLIEFCSEVYTPHSMDMLNHEALNDTHGRATVYCWLFRNMDSATAQALNRGLKKDTAYLGIMDVDFSQPYHLSLFNLSLIEHYRLQGPSCSILYHMADNEDPDLAVKKIFEDNGFKVSFEDIGARGTIFDNYDTLEHARRVGLFKRYFKSVGQVSEDDTSELIMVLEELHPKLFDAFAAAARSLRDAETDEDLAHAALSGRRLLEAVANCLFPPQQVQVDGRKVGKSEYRNRLWAYIAETVKERGGCESLIKEYGKQLDRLDQKFNAGIHSNLPRGEIEAVFGDFIRWLTSLINLSPEKARKPYLAYSDEIDGFMQEALGRYKL